MQRLMVKISNNRVVIFVVFLFTFLLYGPKLFSFDISVDNEAAITAPDQIYTAWLTMGRYGLYFLKKIFRILQYNPYLAGILVIVLLLISCLSFILLFEKCCKKLSVTAKIIFCLLFISSPILADQIAFVMQAPEVILSISFATLSVFFILDSIKNESWWQLIASILFAAFCFSVYQALIPLFVGISASCYFLYLINNRLNSNKDFFIHVLKFLSVFVLSLIVYLLGKQIVFNLYSIEQTSYTQDQILWFSVSFLDCIKSIAKEILLLLTRGKYLYSLLVPVSLVCFSIWIIIILFKKIDNKVWVILTSLFLLGCPFLMTFIDAGHTYLRTMLVTAYVCSFFMMFLSNVLINTKSIINKLVPIVISSLLIIFQLNLSSRLYYTEHVSNVESNSIVTRVADEVEKLTNKHNSTTNIVFIGRCSLNRNHSCIPREELELVGLSLLEFSFSINHGSYIMCNYFSTLGYHYVVANQQHIDEAKIVSQDMPSWPSDGSIVNMGDYVIVKFSDQ